ncbi:MAG: helix-turn-helix transcriptional regulator [Kiritimatiellae bacterium]|nr:helix-turn-helix transcriptional regulator [Kiritimatiellia bacterium]
MMANMVTVLRDEITRLARKEIRKEMAALKTASSRARSDIAALKRLVAAQEKTIAQLAKGVNVPRAKVSKPGEKPEKIKFSANGFRTLRKKLGFTMAEMGRLLDVSPISIYNWEAGKARPRSKHLGEIASIRGLGKKAARARLPEAAEK